MQVLFTCEEVSKALNSAQRSKDEFGILHLQRLDKLMSGLRLNLIVVGDLTPPEKESLSKHLAE